VVPNPTDREGGQQPNRTALGMATAAGALLAYIVLATIVALTKRPISNEAWFANPALTLLQGHYMGTPILETSSTWLRGLDRYTYWIMPLYVLAEAAWFRVIGFGLIRLRLLSICWGLVALGAWWVILRTLVQSSEIAFLGLLLMGTDFTFVTNAGTGRMDMMCAALGFAGLAAYLGWRERNLTFAVLAGNTLVATSGLTHPCGILPFAGLWLLLLYLDHARFQWRFLGIAAVPYLVGAAAWGSYILRNPSLFWVQFAGNISGFAGEYSNVSRTSGLYAPWIAIKNEIAIRYLKNFGLATNAKGAHDLRLLILLAMVAAAALLIARSELRRQRGCKALLLLAAVFILLLTFLEGMKFDSYLVQTIPIFTAILAVSIHSAVAHPLPFLPRKLVLLAVAALVGLQVAVVAGRGWRDPYRRQYLPTTEFLKNRVSGGTLIMGPGELAFELGFNGRVIDDVRLGYYSAKRPDFIVIGDWYRMWHQAAAIKSPEVHRFIEKRLWQEYVEVFRNGLYTIYSRREGWHSGLGETGVGRSSR
jgi:hypothetical protein